MKKKIDDFFSIKNSVDSILDEERKKAADYLSAVKAFARVTYKSIYIIDYEKKGFEYVSENPLFLCGHTAEEVQKMGYAFYFNYVEEKDLDLLLSINTIGFDFYDKLPIEDRLHYTISYDFHIENKESKKILINQKLTPIFLTSEGKIWKAMCIVSLSTEEKSGNIRIYREGDNIINYYDLKGNYWKKIKKIELTKREKEILRFSIRGFTINEIAKSIFVCSDTVKFHRKKLFEKLEVANIAEAISYTINNKLI
ncbi:helix-turn-helix transcriptional regulator [Tenacibaculum tangerinum]|uniref:Helix-turn-helix transcriptional regulator n=1 Tax=Tenacibaculum tangerinum TaxID=3038772 RepID=A0ABY8L674_9FLAO|nr:helix-turn-helix transcriptional regulator [Tenacibaculum tangerinum]WGH76886.1 helix-turn-helix transcriptional regulator [Tenacibaculum tangerinum]